jgi:hypothetical protein
MAACETSPLEPPTPGADLAPSESPAPAPSPAPVLHQDSLPLDVAAFIGALLPRLNKALSAAAGDPGEAVDARLVAALGLGLGLASPSGGSGSGGKPAPAPTLDASRRFTRATVSDFLSEAGCVVAVSTALFNPIVLMLARERVALAAAGGGAAPDPATLTAVALGAASSFAAAVQGRLAWPGAPAIRAVVAPPPPREYRVTVNPPAVCRCACAVCCGGVWSWGEPWRPWGIPVGAIADTAGGGAARWVHAAWALL